MICSLQAFYICTMLTSAINAYLEGSPWATLEESGVGSTYGSIRGGSVRETGRGEGGGGRGGGEGGGGVGGEEEERESRNQWTNKQKEDEIPKMDNTKVIKER